MCVCENNNNYRISDHVPMWKLHGNGRVGGIGVGREDRNDTNRVRSWKKPFSKH